MMAARSVDVGAPHDKSDQVQDAVEILKCGSWFDDRAKGDETDASAALCVDAVVAYTHATRLIDRARSVETNDQQLVQHAPSEPSQSSQPATLPGTAPEQPEPPKATLDG